MTPAGEIHTIYVELFGEGTPVWRPVPAKRLSSGLFEILVESQIPAGEQWAFFPGAVVRCEERQLSGELSLVAIEADTHAVLTSR